MSIDCSVDGTIDTRRHAAVRLRAEERGADPARARQSGRSRSTICSWSATTPSSASRAPIGLRDERIALQAVGRREPRHPAGVLPRRARVGPRRADRGDRRPAARAGVFGPRDDHRRPRPPLLAAQLARRDQRHDDVRRAGHPARRAERRRWAAAACSSAAGSGSTATCPASSNVTVRGEDMQLRFPEGVRSVVDADLALRGNVKSPTLGGSVMVKSAVWSQRIDAPGTFSISRDPPLVRRAAPPRRRACRRCR